MDVGFLNNYINYIIIKQNNILKCGDNHRTIVLNNQVLLHSDLLMDENFNNTHIFIIGKKSGIHNSLLDEFNYLKNIFPDYKFIANMNTYALRNQYELKNESLINLFDAIMDITNTTTKSLNIHHSISDRSFPYYIENKLFHYENNNKKRNFDFFASSFIGDDKIIWKGFPIQKNLIPFLCEKGLKGRWHLSRENKRLFNIDNYKKYIDQGLLEIYHKKETLTFMEFVKLVGDCKYWIHPNAMDAFPKTIIETLLLDLVPIVNDKLFIGLSVLKNIESVFIVDFNDFENIYNIIKNTKWEEFTPRKNWLDKYNFDNNSKIWATEVNRLFNTNYKNLYYLSDLKRIERCVLNKK